MASIRAKGRGPQTDFRVAALACFRKSGHRRPADLDRVPHLPFRGPRTWMPRVALHEFRRARIVDAEERDQGEQQLR